MAKVAVVIRHLKNNRPAVLCVIQEPSYDVISLETYFEYRAKDAITEFKQKFVEFKDADFYVDVIDVN
jgi:hypothetical protein